MQRTRAFVGRCFAVTAALTLAACMSLSQDPRALMDEPDGVRVISFDCGAALRDPARGAGVAQALKAALAGGNVPQGTCGQFVTDLVQKLARAA